MNKKNNKKQMIAKLAGVTMLSTTVLGTVAPLTGTVQGIVGFAEGEKEVTNFTVKGDYSITNQKPVDSTKKLYEWNSITTDQNYIVSINGRVSDGSVINIKTTGLNFAIGSSEIKIGDKVVGKIEYKKGENLDGDLKADNTHYYATDSNINETKNEVYNNYYYKITFNKEIENFENPTVSLSFKGVYSEAKKLSKPSGQEFKIKAQFGDKVVYDDTILFKGYNPITTRALSAGVGNGWYAGTIKQDGSIEQNNFLPFALVTRLNDPNSQELKVGDRIEVVANDNQFVTIGLRSHVKVGDVLDGTDTFNTFNLTSYATNKKSGRILEKAGNTKLKVVETGLNRFVLEVTKVGGEGTMTNLGNGANGPSTNLEILSTKGIDYNKMEMAPVVVNTRILRDGKEIYKNTENYKATFTGAQIGTSGNLIKRGSVVVEFVDENGKSIKSPFIASNNQPVGDAYKVDLTPLKTLDGYQFKGVKPGSASETGKVIEGKQVITLQFEKNKKVKEEDDVEITTKWIDESGKSIKPDVKSDKAQEADKVDGYTFLRTERDGNEVYKHIFKKNEDPKKVVTRFVDEDGKVIKENPGTTPKEDLPDYIFVKTEKDKDGNTIHHYRSITTIFKDEDGNVIKTEKGNKTPDSIPGYSFVKTEKDKDGNTVHTYHKIVTKFVNVKDGKEIVLKTVDGDKPKEDLPGYSFVETKKDPKTGDVTHFYKDNDPAPIETLTIFKDENGNVIKTEKGKKDPDKIPGYTFIKTEVDKDGNTVHTYHKIVTKFVIKKDGKDFVIKTVDGDQPKEDLDGYEFESSEKDPSNGDVIHRYKVKAKVADKKEAVKTGASAGQFILPLVGLGGLGGLVAFVARGKAKRKG